MTSHEAGTNIVDNGTIVCFVIDGDDGCKEDDDDDDEIMVICCDLSECFYTILRAFCEGTLHGVVASGLHNGLVVTG